MADKKISWLKRTAIGGLIGLAGLASGCGSSGQFFEKPSGSLSTTFVSDYVAGHGASIRGQQRQDLLALNVNDKLSAFVWQNYSYDENKINERDFGVSYTLPLGKQLAEAGLSARVGYEYWSYPTGSLGEDDQAIKAGINYHGPVNLDLDVTRLLSHDNVSSGTRYTLKASKNFTLFESEDKTMNASLTPSIWTAVTDNYYGKTMTFPHVTTGVNLGASKDFGKFKVGAGLFLNYQHALPEGKKNGIETFTWGGGCVKISW